MTETSLALKGPKRNLVITVIGDHPKSILLLWAARKRAKEIAGGRWRAVVIETPEYHGRTHKHQLQLLTRAGQMGGETEHIEAPSQLDGLKRALEAESGQLDRIIIGAAESESRLRHWRISPWLRLVHLANRYAQVDVVPLAGQFRQPLRRRIINRLHAVKPLSLLYAIPGVAIPAALAFWLKLALPPALFRINEQNIGFLFLISCAFVAGRYGLLPGLLTAIGGFLFHNYYFTLPYHAIKLESMTDMFSMGLFLSAALLISLFTSRMRDYMRRMEKRENRTEMLLTLYQLTAESYTHQQAVETLQQNLHQMLQAEVALFLPSTLNPKAIEAVSPVDIALTEADHLALSACWLEMKTTGIAAPYNPGTDWHFEPMFVASGEIGVLGVKPRHSSQMDIWFGRLLTAAADQSAAILAQLTLERSMEASRISAEREKLRAMLLSSVSHDLKTPLAGIIGALSAHQTLGERIKEEKRAELIDGALQEALRLNSFITNILDMTRLESGAINFHPEWHPVQALLTSVTKRLKHLLQQHDLVIYPPEGRIEAYMDLVMTGQVLQNLLDNACKYTPPGNRIEVRWKVEEGQGLECEVRDHGSGIPLDKQEHIFDKYTRLQKGDTQTAGTGLGLAISRAILEAQNGWIKATNHPEGGAVFTFCLPLWRYAALPHTQETFHDTGT